MPAITNVQIKLLEKLCNAVAVSGDEGEVRQIVLDEVRPFADEVKVDALGSVLVTRKGTAAKRGKARICWRKRSPRNRLHPGVAGFLPRSRTKSH